jgi:hypothetical protein
MRREQGWYLKHNAGQKNLQLLSRYLFCHAGKRLSLQQPQKWHDFADRLFACFNVLAIGIAVYRLARFQRAIYSAVILFVLVGSSVFSSLFVAPDI